jgi:hypothetical protein
MRSITIAAFLSLTLSLSAKPVITSITPNAGPASGGTTVLITGTGFETCPICSPPVGPSVSFGFTPASAVTLINETTLQVVTPPHIEGPVPVTVAQWDGNATLSGGFTYGGDMFAALEPILLPVFSTPVKGAYGSEFHTLASVSHKGGAGPVLLFGPDPPCVVTLPVSGPYDPWVVSANGVSQPISPSCSPGPAKLLWTPAGRGDDLAFGLRVRDVTRNASSHGTEIPVVRLRDFSIRGVALLDVPMDARFRNTLRVYALQPTDVEILIGSRSHVITLAPGQSEFEPAYAMFTDFPADEAGNARVFVRPLTPITSPPSRTEPIWAFVTVTNNDTQEITVVTPN